MDQPINGLQRLLRAGRRVYQIGIWSADTIPTERAEAFFESVAVHES
jgi:hypothetical protein